MLPERSSLWYRAEAHAELRLARLQWRAAIWWMGTALLTTRCAFWAWALSWTVRAQEWTRKHQQETSR